MSIWDYIRIIWPIASVLTPVLIGASLLWLKSQFALKTEAAAERTRVDACFKDHGAKLADHETRIKLVEHYTGQPPSRQDLGDRIALIGARMSAVEAEVKATNRQLGTANDYLSTLVQQGLRE